MAEAQRAEFSHPKTEPGKRDGGSRPVALIPSTEMRFSPIVSMRAGLVGEGRGKFSQFAARADETKSRGNEMRGREETSATRNSYSGGDDHFDDDLF
jgi:hypothetical protein